MAGFAMTHYGEDLVLNWLCHGHVPPKKDLWIGYLTGSPGETGTGPEVAGNAYARVPILEAATSTGVFGAVTANAAPATGSYCANTVDVDFPVATGNQGSITHIAIWDAQTSGNMLAYKELAVAQTVTAGQQVKFPADKLKISQD